MMDMETKNYLNRIYGMKISNDEFKKLKEIFHSGKTHANMKKVNPININMIKSKDTSLCMYDYAKEILDLTEGYADTDSAK